MKKAIRCCISCILPCGSLDVIRIVHANGRVEEISKSIRACEVMKAYPKHVLKKPTSWSSMESSGGGGAGASEMPRIVILPPDAQLERGKIYFLMPVPAPPPSSKSARRRRRSGLTQQGGDEVVVIGNLPRGDGVMAADSKHQRRSSDGSLPLLSLSSDQYLSEILSEKMSTQRERRRGRVGVWRPHLESICESPGDNQLFPCLRI